jgi:replicative DNA helicase
MDPEAVATVSELLVPDAFYREAHRRIFRAVERLGGARMVVDPTTLTEELRHSGELETIGGMAYIAELLDATPTAANVSYHARIVLDRWTQRRMIEAAGLVAHLGFEPGESVERALDEAQSLVCGIEGDTLGDGLVWTHDAMRGAFADIELRSQCPGGITGVSTGFPDLDELTGGFQGSDLVLVAARPSQGKTAIAVSMALAVAHGGRGVAFFSAEMSKNQIVQRMLCHEARVNLLDMRKGTLDDDAYVQLANVAGPLNTAPLWIDDRSSPSVGYLRGRVRRLQREHPDLALVVVDYLGLCTPRKSENQNTAIGTISADLKALAKDLGVCVLAAHQLSRAPMARGDHRPQLHDLRDSGNLEQDADVVLMVHRPDQYVTPSEAQKEGIVGQAELLIRKQRNGPTGEIPLYFRKECARFETGSWPSKAPDQALPPRRRNGRHQRPDWNEREPAEAR